MGIWRIGAVAVVGLALVGGVLFHFLTSPDSTSSHTSAPQRQKQVGEQNGGVAYGDTAKQVLTKLGSPTRTTGVVLDLPCDAHTLNGEYLGKCSTA